MPSPISPARRTAFDVLSRVERGSWASDLLRAAKLDPRDAALASQIVFGVLRYRSQLDFLIARSTKPKLDIEVRIALRMGIFQLRYLDRIPSHAAVSECVELVKKARKVSAASLVNAVLRKTNRDEVEWPDEATRWSMPPWLWTRWTSAYGDDTAARMAEAALHPPEVFEAGGLKMDAGSRWIVSLLDVQPGGTLLDVCAAPGNKTALAIQAGAQTVACDRHLHRLRDFVADCPRVVIDATQSIPLRRKFDRILVDAPCSGTGTLGRNPEIKWTLKPADIEDLHHRQTRILRNALDLLAPGGRLVYSTCSLEAEENESVLQEVLPGQTVETHRRLPGVQSGDGFFAAVILLT